MEKISLEWFIKEFFEIIDGKYQYVGEMNPPNYYTNKQIKNAYKIYKQQIEEKNKIKTHGTKN